MSQSDLLDIEALTAPISEESPCGTQYESEKDSQLRVLYSEMKWLASEARQLESKRQERASLHPNARKDIQNSDPVREPNWDRVAELSQTILKNHSKDTRVLVNLVDSWTVLHGLAGLRDALSVCLALVEKFQIQLFPAPESGDPPHACLEVLQKAFGQEENQVRRSIRQIDLFGEGEGYTWFAFDHASLFESLDVESKKAYLEAGDRTANDFIIAVQKVTKLQELTALDKQIEDIEVVAKPLDDLVGRLSKNTAGISGVRDTLSKFYRWYRGLTGDRRKELEELAPLEETAAVASDGAPAASSTVTGNVATREQALAALRQTASFFLKTEPHSPLAYALDQAVRWGKMPLPDLLKEIVEDDASLRSVFKRMGIQDKSDESD